MVAPHKFIYLSVNVQHVLVTSGVNHQLMSRPRSVSSHCEVSCEAASVANGHNVDKLMRCLPLFVI